MGHSVVEYRGQARRLRDIEIVTVVHIALDAWRSEPGAAPVTPGVERLLGAWSTMFDTYGPGTLDIELDGFLETEADRESLSGLLQRARDRLAGQGDVVPGDYMNRIVDAPGVLEFVDRPLADVLGAFDRFGAVLAGPPAG